MAKAATTHYRTETATPLIALARECYNTQACLKQKTEAGYGLYFLSVTGYKTVELYKTPDQTILMAEPPTPSGENLLPFKTSSSLYRRAAYRLKQSLREPFCSSCQTPLQYQFELEQHLNRLNIEHPDSVVFHPLCLQCLDLYEFSPQFLRHPSMPDLTVVTACRYNLALKNLLYELKFSRNGSSSYLARQTALSPSLQRIQQTLSSLLGWAWLTYQIECPNQTTLQYPSQQQNSPWVISPPPKHVASSPCTHILRDVFARQFSYGTVKPVTGSPALALPNQQRLQWKATLRDQHQLRQKQQRRRNLQHQLELVNAPASHSVKGFLASMTSGFPLPQHSAHSHAWPSGIILLDDWMTTGETLRELYRVLKTHGESQSTGITALCLTHVPLYEDG